MGTTRRREAAQVKRFLREHEEADPRFAEFMTPQRLGQLFPLMTTERPFACRQLCEPLRPTSDEIEQNPHARAALVHVLQKELRERDAVRVAPRPGTTRPQFERPTPLPFQGESGS